MLRNDIYTLCGWFYARVPNAEMHATWYWSSCVWLILLKVLYNQNALISISKVLNMLEWHKYENIINNIIN